MNSELKSKIVEIGGDPTKPEWVWLVSRGPHGDSFTWGPSRNGPPGYIGYEHLCEILDQYRHDDPDFIEKLSKAVRMGLTSDLISLVRRSIQVISILGSADDIKVIQRFVNHPVADVSSDAKACVFQLKRRA